jgi:uncharacterized protein
MHLLHSVQRWRKANFTRRIEMEGLDFYFSPGRHGGGGGGARGGSSRSQDAANRGVSTGTSNRGFAAMDPEKQREIASKGGKASHGCGRSGTQSGSRTGGNQGGRNR